MERYFYNHRSSFRVFVVKAGCSRSASLFSSLTHPKIWFITFLQSVILNWTTTLEIILTVQRFHDAPYYIHIKSFPTYHIVYPSSIDRKQDCDLRCYLKMSSSAFRLLYSTIRANSQHSCSTFFSSTIVIGTTKYLYSAATMQNYYNGQTKPKKYSCVVFDRTVLQSTGRRINFV